MGHFISCPSVRSKSCNYSLYGLQSAVQLSFRRCNQSGLFSPCCNNSLLCVTLLGCWRGRVVGWGDLFSLWEVIYIRLALQKGEKKLVCGIRGLCWKPGRCSSTFLLSHCLPRGGLAVLCGEAGAGRLGGKLQATPLFSPSSLYPFLCLFLERFVAF